MENYFLKRLCHVRCITNDFLCQEICILCETNCSQGKDKEWNGNLVYGDCKVENLASTDIQKF